MTKAVSKSSVSLGGSTTFLGEGPITRNSDRLLLLGCVVAGTQVLGLVGSIIILAGILVARRAARAGEPVRPVAVTVFGFFSISDASTNLLGWSLDAFAHNTHVGQVFMNGFGRLIDGGYYVDYNTLFLGGSGTAGEKCLQIFGVLALFPARLVGAWAFLKMKRWGFELMVITTWIYAIFWIGYLTNMIQDFPNRMGATETGVVGWWVFDIWYISPMIILPWLYAVNREKWNR